MTGDTGARVQITREGPIVTLQLNHPPLNTFDTTMREALRRAITAIADDDQARAVILTGGERIFAAGADIEALHAMDFSAVLDWNSRLQRVFSSLAQLPVPVVAAVRGYALGGGCELALCADYRIAGENAVFALPEVTLGIMPGSGGTQRLTEIVGRSRAKELLMTGRRLLAKEALELGVVDEVVPDAEVEARAVAYAAALARGPRLAVRAIKEAVDNALGVTPAGLALERSLIAGLFATADKDTGMRSFLAEGPGKAQFG